MNYRNLNRFEVRVITLLRGAFSRDIFEKTLTMKSLLTLLITFLSIIVLSQELLTNGNFTSSGVGWTTTGDFSYNTTFAQYNFEPGYAYSSDDPHDTGSLSQYFTIPANTTNATLSLYTLISTSEQPIQVYDYCTIGIEIIDGSSHQFIQLSNLDANNSYQNLSFTIPSNFYGNNVRLIFYFDNDGLTATRFRFDNISVQATSSGGGGGGSGNPDFYIFNEQVDVASVTAGSDIDVECDQGHQGYFDQNVSVDLGYYLSSDPILSSNDYQFSTTDYSTLTYQGDSDPENATLTIPNTTQTGQYYVLFKADYNDQFLESNEQNNMVAVPLFVNAIATPPPTVSLVSPNIYMCIPTNSTMTIATNISGQISGKKAEYSIDNGLTWQFIDEVINPNTTFNPTWLTPYVTEVTYFKVKITVYSASGNVIDVSDFESAIIPEYQVEDFDLIGTSHLFNPFSNNHWALDGWVNGYHLGYGGYVHGEGTHQCADHYAKDFGKLDISIYDSQVTCNQTFNSPLNGTVIHITLGNSPYCENLNLPQSSFNYGNQIVIQSSTNPDFAFRVSHLNSINSNLTEGDFVYVGSPLGEVGSTGVISAHAHCVLYKNINQAIPGTFIPFLNYLSAGSSLTNSNDPQCNSYKNLFAAKYRLNATPSNGGGSTSIIENSNSGMAVYPNPSNGSIRIKLDAGQDFKEIRMYTFEGKKVEIDNFINSDGSYTIFNLDKGSYLIKYVVNGNANAKKIVVI